MSISTITDPKTKLIREINSVYDNTAQDFKLRIKQEIEKINKYMQMDNSLSLISKEKMKTAKTNHMNLCSFNGEVSSIIWDEKLNDKNNLEEDLFTRKVEEEKEQNEIEKEAKGNFYYRNITKINYKTILLKRIYFYIKILLLISNCIFKIIISKNLFSARIRERILNTKNPFEIGIIVLFNFIRSKRDW